MTRKPKPRAMTEKDVALGEKLRARRILAGLSQQQLAEALGVSFQQVQKYEKGVNRLTLHRLEDAAKALGESVHFFTSDGAKISKAAESMRAQMADPINQRMLAALTKLKTPRLRWAFVHLVENCADAQR